MVKSDTICHEPTDLKCDCCGQPLYMRKSDDGSGYFQCLDCGQNHCFDIDGRHSCKILHKLFPSYENAHDMPPKLRREFIEYRFMEGKFHYDARYLLGQIKEDERDQKISDLKSQVQQFWTEQAELDSRPKWWEFWK